MATDTKPARAWRRLSTITLTITLVGLLVVLPLPRHWPLFRRRFPGVHYELTSFDLYLSDVVLLLVLLTAVPLLRRPRRPAAPRRLVMPLTLLVVWTAVSGVWAFDAFLAAQQAVRLLFLLALFLALARLRPEPMPVIAGAALSVLLQAAVALAQFARQEDLGLRLLGELDLMTQAGGDSILFAAGRYWLRGYGVTPHPNILGGVLAAFLLLLIIPYLQARSRAKIGWLLLLLLAAAGLFVTFSRAAWLAAAVGGLFLLLGVLANGEWRARYGRSLPLLILSAGLLLALMGWSQRGLLFSRFTPTDSDLETRAVNERAALADLGLDLFRLDPLTGIGAGNTAVALVPLVDDVPRVAPQPVHNIPLLLAIELGLPGAALWLWLMAYPPASALARWRQGQMTLWLWGITAVLLALAVTDLFDHYAWSWQQGRLLRWVFLGLWAGMAAKIKD